VDNLGRFLAPSIFPKSPGETGVFLSSYEFFRIGKRLMEAASWRSAHESCARSAPLMEFAAEALMGHEGLQGFHDYVFTASRGV